MEDKAFHISKEFKIVQGLSSTGYNSKTLPVLKMNAASQKPNFHKIGITPRLC